MSRPRVEAKLTVTLYEDGSVRVTRQNVNYENLGEFQYALDEVGEAVLGPLYERVSDQ